MLKGIDVSHYQNSITEYMNDNDFVIIKASEGKSIKDPKRLDHYKTATKNKKLIGFYHYAHPELNTVASEVNNFLGAIPPGVLGNCILVLDWESKALKCNITWACDFLNLVYKRTGVKPLIYCQGSYTNKLRPILNKNYGLWVAQYKNSTVNLPIDEIPNLKVSKPDIGVYPFWAIWQYSDKPIDRNIFNGTKSQFKKYMEVV